MWIFFKTAIIIFPLTLKSPNYKNFQPKITLHLIKVKADKILAKVFNLK